MLTLTADFGGSIGDTPPDWGNLAVVSIMARVNLARLHRFRARLRFDIGRFDSSAGCPDGAFCPRAFWKFAKEDGGW